MISSYSRTGARLGIAKLTPTPGIQLWVVVPRHEEKVMKLVVVAQASFLPHRGMNSEMNQAHLDFGCWDPGQPPDLSVPYSLRILFNLGLHVQTTKL